MEQKIIFIDVDGTLVGDNGVLFESTLWACEQLKKKGHKLYLCTGRSKAELHDNIMSIGFDGFICAGGSYLENEGQVLMHLVMEQDDVRAIVDILDKHNMDYFVECSGGLYASENCIPKLMKLMKLDHIKDHPFTACLTVSRDYYGKDVSKICFLEGGLTYQKIADQFSDRFEIIPCTVPVFGKESGEIAIKGVSKSKTIRILLDALHADVSQTIAIGDGGNDIDMIQLCNLGIAMGNAKESLKQVADMITDDLYEDGFCKAFIKAGLLEDYKQ